MKNKNLFYLIGMVLLLVFAFIFWNNYQVDIQKRPQNKIGLPPQLSGKCGFENCHGLDLTCGPNVPDACTEMYSLGDNCRQFASCEESNGDCQLVTSPEFTDCKACVERCISDFSNDPESQFTCEGNCTEDIIAPQ